MVRPLRRLALAALAPLLLAGCADPAPTSPSAGGPPAEPLLAAGGGGLDPSKLARFDQRPSITIAWAKRWIGPEGGRLEFAGFAIEVPAGAVDRTTQFSIRLPVDPRGSEHVLAEFGPHGREFAVPVAIELPFDGTSIFGETGSKVVWGNPESGEWEPFPTEVTGDGQRLRTVTPHFSLFGTMRPMGTTTLVSGG